jgi:hypothetical protein
MTKENTMFTIRKIALSAAIVLSVAFVFTATDAFANGPWCAYYNDGGDGDPHCGFATLQQCLADVHAIGGSCGPSPYL